MKLGGKKYVEFLSSEGPSRRRSSVVTGDAVVEFQGAVLHRDPTQKFECR